VKRLVCLALSSLAFALSPASAGPLVPTKPSQIVAAQGTSASVCPNRPTAFHVNALHLPTGSQASLAIPPKSVFVVTGVDVALLGGEAGAMEPVIVFATDAAGNLGSLVRTGGIAGSDGGLIANVALATGFVLQPPANLCFEMLEGRTGSVVAHGFFAKDR
jgi:hypothetical protein